MTDRKDKLRVCYFGTYSRGEEYSRNNAIISGLEHNGVEVLECQVDVFPTHEQKMKAMERGAFFQGLAFLKAYLKLAFKYMKVGRHDFVFVGYIGHIDMFPARLLAWLRRKPVVFDAFFSIYNTVVEDRGLYSPGSLIGKMLWQVDRWSSKLADLTLIDTWAYVDYFCKVFDLDRKDFLAIPLGTDEKNFYPRPWPEEDGVLDCITYSSYIPLHGLETQLRAAKLLEGREDIRFTFVGMGQLYQQMRELAEELKLTNVTFIEWLSHGELVERIAGADVCLGIFGKTVKADTVIPYKVYEALAMRKPVVTGDSKAAHELLEDGVHVLMSPMGDPEALARRIEEMQADPEMRKALAEKGHELFMQKCTSKAIAGAILDDMARRWPEKMSAFAGNAKQ